MEKTRRGSFTWGIVALIVIAIASAASCSVGYAAFKAFRTPTPTPTPTRAVVVNIEQIRQQAELATVKYTLSTDITSARVPDDIRKEFGVKEEIVLIAYGEVAAGFDLGKLDQDALWMEGTRVQLHLPAPEILYVKLDNERTHVVYYEKSWFIDHDLDIEGKARQEAEESIRQAALESEVLQRAREYGQLFFENWFYSMGFAEVRVIVD
jgi:hypothetical protein